MLLTLVLGTATAFYDMPSYTLRVIFAPTEFGINRVQLVAVGAENPITRLKLPPNNTLVLQELETKGLGISARVSGLAELLEDLEAK